MSIPEASSFIVASGITRVDSGGFRIKDKAPVSLSVCWVVGVTVSTMEFRSIGLKRDPKCPICGANPQIAELKDEPDAGGASGSDRDIIA